MKLQSIELSPPSEIKIDLTEPFEHLAKAPIVEAAIGIDARAEGIWEQSEVSQQLKPKLLDYPIVVSQTQLRQKFKLGPGKAPEPTTQELGWKGLRFQSADERHIAQFNRDGFLFSRLHPYESWEQLSGEAMRLWQVYIELARPTKVHRIGLRYINRLELPPQDRRFEDYVQPAPEPPRALELPFHGFFHHDTLAVPGHDYAINVIRTIQLPNDPRTEGVGLILDIDVFSLQPFELRQDMLAKRLAEMRWLKNKVFFGSITKKALNTFK